MLKLHRILVATDFSDASRASYTFANNLAGKYGGQINLIHVIPSYKYLHESISRLGLPLDMDKDLYPHLVTETEERLIKDMEGYIDENHRGISIVKVDVKPSETIVRLAEETKTDLIIVGTVGRSEKTFLKGSTTNKLVRITTVPVLSVPKTVTANGINRILVPTDYSELSFHAVRGAAALADSLDATIILYHVIELYGSLSENEPRDAGRDEIETIREKLISKLDAWFTKHPEFKMKLERTDSGYQLSSERYGDKTTLKLIPEIVKGISAHYEIIDYALDSADMVVMTTHGRSGLSHLFLGSTTERVIHATNKPVLTWRPPETQL